MKNFKRRFSLSVPRTETIEESLAEFTEQFTQLHNQRNEGEGPSQRALGRRSGVGTGLNTPPGGGQLMPICLRPAAQWRPPAGAQHLVARRQQGGAGAPVPWHAVPPAAEPAPLFHGGEWLPALPRPPMPSQEGGWAACLGFKSQLCHSFLAR